MPTGNIETIETALAALLEPIVGIQNVIDHEPRELPALRPGQATATIMWRSVEPIDAETGPGQDVTYTWSVNLYVHLHDFRASQSELKELVPRVVAIFREDFTLGRTVDFVRWRDLDGEPVHNPKQGYLRKTLVCEARLTERG